MGRYLGKVMVAGPNPAEGSTKSLLLSFAGFVTSIDLLPADDKSKLVCRLESRCNVVFFDYFL